MQSALEQKAMSFSPATAMAFVFVIVTYLYAGKLAAQN